VQDKVILALERQRRFDDAIKEREEFTRLFGKGTEWERRNRNNPEALRKAREFDEQALIQAAVFHHKAGQELKKRATAMNDMALLAQAKTEYEHAAKAYKKYLERFPDTKNSYEIRYSYASCLFYSARYLEAAPAFAEVRDSNLDDRYREDAAFSATKAYEEHILGEIQAGRLSEPPLPTAKSAPASLKPQPIPEAYARWQKSLDEYGRLLPKDPKTPRLVYKSAEISYRYLQFDDARKRFAAIFKEHCGDVMAVNAAQAILVTYQLEKNIDEMEKWASQMQSGKCLKGTGGEDAAKLIAGSKLLLDGIKFKRARDLHAKGDELMKAGKAQEAAPYYDKAAVAYLALVERSPDSEDADKALNNAAVCYEQSRRFESATKLYERLWQKYPKSPLAGDALWRAAINYERFFEFDRAVQNYLILADSANFADDQHRVDAVFNAARLLENDQAYDRSAKLFLRHAGVAKNREEAAKSFFQAGLIYEKMKDFPKMVKTFRDFPREYGAVRGMAGKSVEASFRIGKTAQQRNDWSTAEKYYKAAISQYAMSGEKPGSEAAENAAYAAFQIAENKLAKYLKTELKGSLQAVDAGRKRMEKEAVALKREYERIWDYKAAKWTLAAMYRSGTVMEHFARAVAKGFNSAPLPPKVKRLGQEAIDIYQEAVSTKLEEVVRPLEDESKKLYAACVERAKSFGVSNKYTEEALARLNAFDPAAYPLLKRAQVEIVLE
jgi:tetratricopeptide (TPR) repeat protein